MKRSLSVSVLILVLSVLLNNCKSKCADTSCMHGGVCNDGSCDCKLWYGGKNCEQPCALGYGGDNCNVLVREKFIRTWSAITTSTAGTKNHSLQIKAGPSLSTFYIANFNGDSFTVIATVSNKYTFDIFTQNATGHYTGTVSGSGYLSSSKLAIDLTIQNGTHYFTNCNP